MNWLVDLNYIFECDWLIKLSDNKLSNNKLSNNKLSDNNLASELVENRTFLNQSQARKLSFLWSASGLLTNYPTYKYLSREHQRLYFTNN